MATNTLTKWLWNICTEKDGPGEAYGMVFRLSNCFCAVHREKGKSESAKLKQPIQLTPVAK